MLLFLACFGGWIIWFWGLLLLLVVVDVVVDCRRVGWRINIGEIGLD